MVQHFFLSICLSSSTVTNRAVLILQPSWPKIYHGETVTFKCKIEDGGDTEWTYEWKQPRSFKHQNDNEYMITSASSSDNGDYRCSGKMKNGESTEWSEAVRLTVFTSKFSVLILYF